MIPAAEVSAVASETIRRQNQIQSGSITSGTVPAGSNTDFTVTFDVAFGDVPTAVAMFNGNTSQRENMCFFSRTTATTTNATFRLVNTSASDISLSSNRKIDWIAVL